MLRPSKFSLCILYFPLGQSGLLIADRFRTIEFLGIFSSEHNIWFKFMPIFHALHKTKGPNALCVFLSFSVCNCEEGCGLHTTPEVKLFNTLRLFFCIYLVCMVGLVSLQIFATQKYLFSMAWDIWKSILGHMFE